MKRIVAVLCVCVFAVPVFASSFNKSHVAADAQWVMHCRVADMLKSRLGQLMYNALEAEDSANQFASFRAIFQFDPQKDMTSLTVYGTAADPESIVALIGGRFNVSHINTVIKGMDGYKAHPHQNTVVHEWPANQDGDDGDDTMFSAFHGNDLMIAGGNADAVKKALDVVTKAKPSLSNPVLLQGVDRVIPGAYLQAAADLSKMEGMAQGGDMMRQFKSMRLALGETLDTLNLQLVLGAVSAEAAEQMHAMAQGFLAMAQMQQADNPDIAKLMQRLSINVKGSYIQAALKIPVNEAVEAVEKMQEQARAVVAPPAVNP